MEYSRVFVWSFEHAACIRCVIDALLFFVECPVGTFGEGCQELCECVGGETCDHVTGKCNCAEGRKGFHCEEGTVLKCKFI